MSNRTRSAGGFPPALQGMFTLAGMAVSALFLYVFGGAFVRGIAELVLIAAPFAAATLFLFGDFTDSE